MQLTTPFLAYLQDATKTLPMLAIEVPTTLGRTYQGYKNGGKSEGREKICEETLTAVVWLFGVTLLNKLGDIIGDKIFHLKDLGTDVGKDSLRNPFENVTDKRAFTAAFKFSKIAVSALLGTLAMGVVVPKIKVAMTNAFRLQRGEEPIPSKGSKDGAFHPGAADKLVSFFIKPKNNSENVGAMQEKAASLNLSSSMSDFIKKTASNQPSFKGALNLTEGLKFASHNLENNTAWKLLTTDAGMLAGRVFYSRSNKERIEYAVRDSSSDVAYIFAAPAFSYFLRKISNTPNVQPRGAEAVASHLKTLIIDKKDVEPGYFSKGFLTKEKQADLIKDIEFNSNKTIWLDDFNLQTAGKYSKKAEQMSLLQSKLLNKSGVKASILSEKQVVDIMSDSCTSDPAFLKKAVSLVTKGKSDDPNAFVSRKKLEKIRESFDDFVLSLENYAKKKNVNIDNTLIDKFTKRLNRKNLAFHISGLGFAVFLLAYAIPKFQYLLSEKLTGKKGFAGEADLPSK